ncbi:MAG: hypothetical protein M1370_12150 [Bacteroidetes bacterium]|nr:hypothetical protein [Bacteroidota bacterium]MCL5026918.1 hypothetical protein [Chloroflexota bacterium]
MEQSGRGHWIDFTAYTASQVISGRLNSVHLRFTDAFSFPLTDYLSVDECWIAPVGLGRSPLAQRGQVQLYRPSLVFVIPGVEPEVSPAEREDLRVAKTAHPVALLASSWLISGRLHVPAGTAPEEAMNREGEQFLPVTDATITHTTSPELRINAEVVLVNRAFITVCWPRGLPRL